MEFTLAADGDGVHGRVYISSDGVIGGRDWTAWLDGVESRGQQHTAALTLGERGGYEIVSNEKAGRPVTDEMKALREAWLGSKAKVPADN